MSSVPTVPKTFVLGITGPISSGKSTVSKVLEAEGIPVLDTDDVVRDLYQHDDQVKGLLAQNFGDSIIDKTQNRVNNAVLRDIVFKDEQKRNLLESLVYPFVTLKVQSFIAQWQGKVPIIAVQVPKLFESGTQGLYNGIWALVVRPIDTLIERLIERTQRVKNYTLSPEEARKWLSCQWSQEEKAAKANQIIENNGTVAELEVNTRKALADLRQRLTVPV